MSTRIHTFSGTFSPFTPSPDEVRLEDIARGLAQTCRFGGQTPTFYSVAQHAVLCANLVHSATGDTGMALLALHHDSAEAYLGDIPRPIKRGMLLRSPEGLVEYDAAEAAVFGAICRGLNLPTIPGAADWVRAADEAMLRAELQGFFGADADLDPFVGKTMLFCPPLTLRACVGPEQALDLFLQRHHELVGDA